MKLTVLVDNNTLIGRRLLGEPGLSMYLETDDKRILFDAGYSDAFIRNAAKLNINLSDLDFVVLSHGHYDHTWGLIHLVERFSDTINSGIEHLQPVLIAHPHALSSKVSHIGSEKGSLLSEDRLGQYFDLRLSREPVWLTDNLVFLGEIERKNNFETTSQAGTMAIDSIDFADLIIDDSALAFRSDQGLVIITGCSHSGICNIVDYAKKITKSDKVIDIIGGFHLLNPLKARLEGTTKYLKKLKLNAIHACHCTDLDSKIALSKVADLKEVGSGLTIEYQ